MTDHPDTLTGPDFLESLADIAAGNGEFVNCAEFRTRAAQWRRDLRDIAHYRGIADRAEARASAAPATTTPRAAITPTDTRN